MSSAAKERPQSTYVPNNVCHLIWQTTTGIDKGRLLRSVGKNGKVRGETLSGWAVWSVVEQAAKQIGVERFGARDPSVSPADRSFKDLSAVLGTVQAAMASFVTAVMLRAIVLTSVSSEMSVKRFPCGHNLTCYEGFLDADVFHYLPEPRAAD